MLPALSGALVGGRSDVALKVHSVAEDAHDFDCVVRCGPVHQEMIYAAAAPRNVERAKACLRLSRTKTLGGPFEDIGEVDLSGSAEPRGKIRPTNLSARISQ